MRRKIKLSASDIANICSTIVAVSALLFSVYQYKLGSEQEAENSRPMLNVIKVTFGLDSITTKVQPIPIIQNFGKKPAYNCQISSFEIQKINNPENYKLIDSSRYSISNPLVSNTQFNFNLKPIPKDSSIFYFKLILKYSDVNSRKIYNDSLYYKFQPLGSANSYSNNFFNMEVEEAKTIDNFLHSQY